MTVKLGKANSTWTETNPQGTRNMILPEFLHTLHMKIVILSVLRIDRLDHSRRYTWYSFMSEDGTNPGT